MKSGQIFERVYLFLMATVINDHESSDLKSPWLFLSLALEIRSQYIWLASFRVSMVDTRLVIFLLYSNSDPPASHLLRP